MVSSGLHPGALFEERYLIKRLLGGGGFGQVYLASDQRFQQDIAVKAVYLADDDQRRQFEREAQILRGLKHPGLPQVYDYVLTPPHGYLIMEFIEGQPLDVAMAPGRVPEQLLRDVLRAIAEILGYIHQRGVLHRDLKPGNILRRPDGQITLVDFGLVKLSGHQTTAVRALTPGYSPVEQYTGGTDARSDLYALGATCYLLLTGRVPTESLQVLLGQAPPLVPVSALRPDVSAQFGGVIQKLMALRAEERYQSVAELQRDLQAPAYVQLQPTWVAPALAPSPPPSIGPTIHVTPPAQERPAPYQQAYVAPPPARPEQHRPIGITILAILSGFAGPLALFAASKLLTGGDSFYIEGMAAGIASLTFLFVGLLALAFAYGAWRLRPWAWYVGLALQILIILLDLFSLNTGNTMDNVLPSLIINGLLIVYLMLPNVKRAFRRP